MDSVTLPLDQEAFASEDVAAGRYRSVSDAVVGAVSLLERHQQARAKLPASVGAAKEVPNRDSCLTGDVRATFALRT